MKSVSVVNHSCMIVFEGWVSIILEIFVNHLFQIYRYICVNLFPHKILKNDQPKYEKCDFWWMGLNIAWILMARKKCALFSWGPGFGGANCQKPIILPICVKKLYVNERIWTPGTSQAPPHRSADLCFSLSSRKISFYGDQIHVNIQPETLLDALNHSIM